MRCLVLALVLMGTPAMAQSDVTEDEYRWQIIDELKSAPVADLLINAPESINRRLFIDAAKLLEKSTIQ